MRSESPAEDQLRRIDAVTDTTLSHLDLQELLNELLDRVRELLRVDTATVLLYDERVDELIATAAAGIEEEVRQGVRVPLGRGFAGRIAAEKRSVMLERVDDATVINPLLWEKGLRSMLGVPLLAGGDTVGVLHVGSLTQREFGEEDEHLLQLVADRIALAVRAQLSSIERATASTLQRSLLPLRLPSIPGIEFATRYVPGPGSHVSGDWYDLFELPSGSWGLVIGDVTGHGLTAATVMGRIRSVLRAYAMDHDDPAATLAKLDQYVRQFEPGLMATVAYAIFEPSFDRLRISLAGHLAPIVALPQQQTAMLDLPVDPPIGIHRTHIPRRTSTVDVPTDALFCLFTDGLVERRGTAIDEGLKRLCGAISPGPVESVCAHVMAELVGTDEPQDDIAVLMVRQYTVATDAVNLNVAAVPESLGHLRATARRWLAVIGAGPEEAAELLVAIGEACSNVVEHSYGPAGGAVMLRLECQGDDAVARIRDTGRWRAPRGEHRGRGTALMRAFSDSLTVEKASDGTTVTMRRRLTNPRTS
jgi:serine phosphatase RsbU (regulator of sigma subunit)/anti-sigma regulatory factor (Ser/Thr protein kinase)